MDSPPPPVSLRPSSSSLIYPRYLYLHVCLCLRLQTMRTAEQQFRQANDPNGGTGNARFGGSNDPDASGSRSRMGADEAGAGNGQSRAFPGRPTILFRESSTLFRRASVSFCRRLGEADSALLETDIMSLQVMRSCALSRDAWGRASASCVCRTSPKLRAFEKSLPSRPRTVLATCFQSVHDGSLRG